MFFGKNREMHDKLMETAPKGPKPRNWFRRAAVISIMVAGLSLASCRNDGKNSAPDVPKPEVAAAVLKGKPQKPAELPPEPVKPKTFERRFGGPKFDEALSAAQTSDGGYIIAGQTKSSGAGKMDAWLVKLDADGKEAWNKTFGGSKDDEARSVVQAKDGGYVMAGHTESFGKAKRNDVLEMFTPIEESVISSLKSLSNESEYEPESTYKPVNEHTRIRYNAWLVKTDEKGNEVWNKTLEGTLFTGAYSVQQASDGGYVIAGSWRGPVKEGKNRDAWLVKTDGNGNNVWDKRFGGIDHEEALSAQQTKDGGYILAGYYTNPAGMGHVDCLLIKTDKDGNKLWRKIFRSSPGNDAAHTVQQTRDGGYLIGGFTASNGGDALLIKTDENGNKIWEKTFGGPYWDTPGSVQQTSDGGYIVAMAIRPSRKGDRDIHLIKTDESGNSLWEAKFGDSSAEDVARSVLQTADGGYMIVGYSKPSGSKDFHVIDYVIGERIETSYHGQTDAYVIKTDEKGNVR